MCMFSFLLHLLFVSSTRQISNQWIDLVLIDDASQGYAGSVWSLLDKYSGMYLANLNFPLSCVRCDDYAPSSGFLVCSDTSAVFTSESMSGPQGTLPIGVTITYTLVDRGMEITYRLEFFDDVELLKPLEVVFNTQGWETATLQNQSGLDETFPLDASTWYQRFSGSQLLRLTGGATPPLLFVFPNVSKGILWIEDYGQPRIAMRFFDTEHPRENCQGPDLHSVVPAGEVREYFVRISLDENFSPLFISNHPFGYERTAAWMVDELPFIHPLFGYIWDYSENSSGPEPISASLIRLLEDHPTMKMNWLLLPDGILAPNRDSVWAEPGWEESWSHSHGTWRINTQATEAYKQWLINIQNSVYPWSERVRMGSHGYHHTPNADSSYGEFHEFITYEPQEHCERFRMNALDIADIGLDTNLVEDIRFAGHRTSLSGLWAVIDHGFKFYCNGWRMIDWFAGKQFRNQWITMYQTPQGRIWGSNTVWWADYVSSHPYEYLSEVLDKGKFALFGCHPGPMLGGGFNPEAYARIDSVLTSMEQDYDNFGWLFPIEYGNYLEACYNITVRSIRNQGGLLTMEFEGAVPNGMTFCASLDPDDIVISVILDEYPLEWELRSGGRLFATTRAFEAGNHTLEVLIQPIGIDTPTPRRILRIYSPSHTGAVQLRISGENPAGLIQILLFDLSGRIVASDQVEFCMGEAMLSFPGSLPAGFYCVQAQVDGVPCLASTVLLN